jgi:glycosyltransferase involved in cell wall biosynthesis
VQSENKKSAVICFCNSNLAWGGGEKWHLESAVYFAGLGYKVFLAADPRGELWPRAQKFSGLRLSPWKIGNLSFLNPFKRAAFTRFLTDSGVTHLILNLPADLKLGMRAASAKPGLPIKTYYRRGSAIPVYPSAGNRRLFSGLTAIIANSNETAAGVLKSKLIEPGRIKVIYNGLDIAGFDAALQASGNGGPARSRPVSGDFPLIIGNAGRLSLQKAQKYLLHMSVFLKKQAFPHCLVIAGDGELRAELLALAGSLELDFVQGREILSEKSVKKPSGVYFAGFVQEMPLFWRNIDLFVLSSVWEGFGYALAEAMLAGKALLAFNCNSMPELVKDGLNGCLLSPPGPEESAQEVGARLAERVMAMAGDLAGLQRMGEAGRKFCLENFDQKIAMQKLEQLLFSGEEILTPVTTVQALHPTISDGRK